MNARKLAIGGVLAVLVGMAVAPVSHAGVIQNDSKYPILIRSAYYDPNTGFAWGPARVLPPGYRQQVADGSNVFVSWQHLNGQWSQAHQLGYGQATDYLFVSGSMVYVDVTRR
jgi:hypothetical protein